ncbi:MAG: DNA replication terminus site-binding protein [Candidatus Competibacteraceae bacterium]
MNQSLLRVVLLESFEQLLAALDNFCILLRQDATLPAWVSRTEEEVRNGLESRLKAIDLYQSLWYEDSQDGRETLTCPGVVGASPETLIAAGQCNDAKDTFKAAVLALKTLPKSEVNTLMLDLHKRHEAVAAAMKRMGAARLHLKQAYRHIPVLQQRPEKIGFTWSKQGRTIQRTSVPEARRLLQQRRETPQVQLELQRLVGLPKHEVLARVRQVCPHLRANLVFAGPGGSVRRRLMQAPLPILLPLQVGERLPEFVPIAPEPVGSLRLQRSDIRIEEEVFLPSIRAYRYRERYRDK